MSISTNNRAAQVKKSTRNAIHTSCIENSSISRTIELQGAKLTIVMATDHVN